MKLACRDQRLRLRDLPTFAREHCVRNSISAWLNSSGTLFIWQVPDAREIRPFAHSGNVAPTAPSTKRRPPDLSLPHIRSVEYAQASAAISPVRADLRSRFARCSTRARTIPESPAAPYSLPNFREGFCFGSAYMRPCAVGKQKWHALALTTRNKPAPTVDPKNGASALPWAEYGFTGQPGSGAAPACLRPHSGTHSAAAHIATAPPRDVPSRSNDEARASWRTCNTRSAVPRIEWSMPRGRSENPAPSRSGAYTVAIRAPVRAWRSATKRNNPEGRAAESTADRNPHASSACARHRNPSSTLRRPRPKPEHRETGIS